MLELEENNRDIIVDEIYENNQNRNINNWISYVKVYNNICFWISITVLLIDFIVSLHFIYGDTKIIYQSTKTGLLVIIITNGILFGLLVISLFLLMLQLKSIINKKNLVVGFQDILFVLLILNHMIDFFTPLFCMNKKENDKIDKFWFYIIVSRSIYMISISFAIIGSLCK